jgi:hypothetical protein
MDEPPPDVVIADAARPAVARLGYDGEFGCIEVVLDDPPRVRVANVVYAEFAWELTDFFGLLGRRFADGAPGRSAPRGLRGGWRVASNDDELCVEAWGARKGFVEVAVSLAADTQDPNWVVRVNLSVASADLPGIAAAAARLAYYANSPPQAPDAEPHYGPANCSENPD